MQVVILAAGEGKRLQPLTDHIPKSMVSVLEKPILEHILSCLPKTIDEIIIVIGRRGAIIQKHFGDTWNNIPLHYVIQDNQNGTAIALRTAQPLLRDRFLVMPADDIHRGGGLERLVQHPLGILAAESEHPERFGVLSKRDDGSILSIDEKPKNPASNLVSTGVFVLDTRIFNYTAPAGVSGEFYLTDLVNQFLKDSTVLIEHTDLWCPIAYPEDITKAEKLLSTFTDEKNS